MILASTILMLLIIIPVMALTIFFAWRYRASNRQARYEPDWDHSTQLELVIWAAPLLIIICLGAITWTGTHLLDPYRPVGRVAPGKPVAAQARPLEVQVVALDWKWLFIYPEYGIATVNELAAPVDRPIQFHITSSTVMNSFFIPALAGQIYAMPGMETTLHAVLNKPGDYTGFSANYSGAGFSGMRFGFHGMDDAGFAQWVDKVRHGGRLDRAAYLQLERPSENTPVHHYGSVEAGLYDAALNMCVTPGKMCMNEMMRIDAAGGLGLAGINNVGKTMLAGLIGRDGQMIVQPGQRHHVSAICTSAEKEAAAGIGRQASPAGQSRLAGAGLTGAGLARPGLLPPSLSTTAMSTSATVTPAGRTSSL